MNFSRRKHIKHCGFCIAQKFYRQTFQEHPEPELTENQRFSQAGAFATLCLFYIALSCFVCLSSSSKMTNSRSVAPGISGNSVEAEDGEVPFKLRIASPSPTAARKTFEINPSLWCHENVDYLSCGV